MGRRPVDEGAFLVAIFFVAAVVAGLGNVRLEARVLVIRRARFGFGAERHPTWHPTSAFVMRIKASLFFTHADDVREAGSPRLWAQFLRSMPRHASQCWEAVLIAAVVWSPRCGRRTGPFIVGPVDRRW